MNQMLRVLNFSIHFDGESTLEDHDYKAESHKSDSGSEQPVEQIVETQLPLTKKVFLFSLFLIFDLFLC